MSQGCPRHLGQDEKAYYPMVVHLNTTLEKVQVSERHMVCFFSPFSSIHAVHVHSQAEDDEKAIHTSTVISGSTFSVACSYSSHSSKPLPTAPTGDAVVRDESVAVLHVG